MWRRAVDAAWTDAARFCVEGSRVPVNNTPSVVDPRFRQMGTLAEGVRIRSAASFARVVAVLVALAFYF